MSDPKPHLENSNSPTDFYTVAQAVVKTGVFSATIPNGMAAVGYGVKTEQVETILHYYKDNFGMMGLIGAGVCLGATLAMNYYQNSQDKYYNIAAHTSKISPSSYIHNSVSAKQTDKFKRILRKAALISMAAGAVTGVARCSCTPAPAGGAAVATHTSLTP